MNLGLINFQFKVDYSYCNIVLAYPSMFVHKSAFVKYYVTLLNRANPVQHWTVFKNCCSSVVESSVAHCSEVQCCCPVQCNLCSTVQCFAVQCSAVLVQCRVVQCSAAQSSTNSAAIAGLYHDFYYTMFSTVHRTVYITMYITVHIIVQMYGIVSITVQHINAVSFDTFTFDTLVFWLNFNVGLNMLLCFICYS